MAPETTSTAPAAGGSGRGRRVAIAVLIVLTFVGVYASTLAVTAQRTLLDTDRFVAVIDDSLDKPEVQEGLSSYVSKQLIGVLRESEVVAETVPDDLAFLVPIIERTVENALADRTAEFIASDRGSDLILGATRRAHTRVMAVLEGEPPESELVTVDSGTVRIDLLPVAIGIIGSLGADGFVFDRLGIDPEAPRDEQLDALGEALGRDIDDDFATFVVYEADQSVVSAVGTARRALELFRTATWLLVVLTLALAAAAVVLARDKHRTALFVTGGGVLAALLARATIQATAGAVRRSASSGDDVAAESRRAAGEVLNSLVDALEQRVQFLLVVLLVALVLLVVLLLWSRRAPAPAAADA